MMKSRVFALGASLTLLSAIACSNAFLLAEELEGTGSSTTTLSLTIVNPTTSALAGGGTLMLTGSGFEPSMTVKIGATDCTGVLAPTATTATCTLPAKTAGTYPVIATLADATQATLASAIVYAAALPAPNVTSISPTGGLTIGGTSITITGTGFQSSANVEIDGIACASIVVATSTSITCVTPAGSAGAVDVVVTNPDAQTDTLAGAFTYRVAPTLTQLRAGVFTNWGCLGCHGAMGGLNLASYASITASSRAVPGDPNASKIYYRVRDGEMPAGGGPTASDKQDISDWILAGAQDN